MTPLEFEENVIALTETLYRVSSSLLPRLCDRQDAVQNCILQAWQHQGSVRKADAFKPWLIRILINECYTLMRKNKRLVFTEVLPEAGCTPNDRDEALHDAVQALPEMYRLPVVLFYMEGAGIEDISRILRIPAGTVKSRLSKARRSLKGELTR